MSAREKTLLWILKPEINDESRKFKPYLLTDLYLAMSGLVCASPACASGGARAVRGWCEGGARVVRRASLSDGAWLFMVPGES